MEKKDQTYCSSEFQGNDRIDEELWFSSLAADDRHKYDADKAFQRFRKRVGLLSRKSFWIPSYMYYAASVLLLVVVSAVSFWQGERHIQNDFLDIAVEAPLGSKTKVRLPDGTSVWLNAGSRIVYSQGFGVSNRDLDLQGEAYFEVEKNEELPFFVHTTDLDLTVVGTKFNFRNYAEDENVVVDLLEGKVSLKNRLKQMDGQDLSVNEKMILDKKTGEMKIVSAQTENAKGWTDDIFLFDQEPLLDIVHQLERVYDVKIRIDNDSLKEECFYGSFNSSQQNVSDVLDILSATGRLRYEKKNDIIIIK